MSSRSGADSIVRARPAAATVSVSAVAAASPVGSGWLTDRHATGALVLAFALALPAVVPLLSLPGSLFTLDTEVWAHLSRYVLPEVALNTAKLVAGVAILTANHRHLAGMADGRGQFPWARFLTGRLLLPLAIPGYVLASLPLGFSTIRTPQIRNARSRPRNGVVSCHSLRQRVGCDRRAVAGAVPVCLPARAQRIHDPGTARPRGGPDPGFTARAAAWRVALPMARPWIAAGVSLVAMETLADFGTVSVFNYNTFTKAIYSAWFGMFSVSAALELAAFLMLFVLAALWLERRSRSRVRVRRRTFRGLCGTSHRAQGQGALVCVGLGVAGLSARLPVAFLQIVIWAMKHAASDLDVRYFGFALRSLVLEAAPPASLSLPRSSSRMSLVCSPVPGPICLPDSARRLCGAWNGTGRRHLRADGMVQRSAARMAHGVAGSRRDCICRAAVTVLVAYMARFLAVGFGPVDSSLQRVTRNIDEAAISLGVTGMAMLKRVHLPLLRTGIATGAVLVFVDVMKEMPITLITRPFGWDTLAVRVFEMTTEGEWERAALPAVVIVLAGLVPIALLTRRGTHVA